MMTARGEPADARLRLVRLDALPEELSVRLFVERYTDKGGTWETARDTPATTTIVTALGGLPLAIELVAARAARTRLPLAAVAAEVSTPAVLARLQDPLEPSANVRYSLSKTLTSLSPSQRVRFAALGLPEGPDWPLPVIESLLAGVPADPELTSTSPQGDLEALIAYSLVSFVAGSEGVQRVRLHPLVRALAREEFAHLPAPEQEAALHALLIGIADRLAQHQSILSSASMYHQLALDEELIITALRRAVERHVSLSQVNTVIKAWETYLFLSRLDLGIDIHTLALASARLLGDHAAEYEALNSIGNTHYFLGNLGEAKRYNKEALAIIRELEDPVKTIISLETLANLTDPEESLTELQQMYDEVLTLAGKVDKTAMAATNPRLLNTMLNSVGMIAFMAGHLEEAEQCYQQAFDIAHAREDRANEMALLCNFGFLYDMMGKPEAAQLAFEQALAMGREFGGANWIGVPLNGLGQIALKRGDLDNATHRLMEALPARAKRRRRCARALTDNFGAAPSVTVLLLLSFCALLEEASYSFFGHPCRCWLPLGFGLEIYSGRLRLGWIHQHCYRELAFCLAMEDAVRRRHIGVIPPNRHTDVAVTGRHVIGGVEAHPAQPRQKGLDPGMGRTSGRPVGVLLLMIQIAAHVTGGNAERADQRNHDVGKILTDPSTYAERVINRRVDVRVLLGVLKGSIDRSGDVSDDGEGIIAALDLQFFNELGKGLARPGKVAGMDGIPIVVLSRQGIDLIPGVGREGLWQGRGSQHLNLGFRGDGEMSMAVGHVEVVDPVAVFASIAVDLGHWAGPQTKIEAVLVSLATWLQVHLHDAFRNGQAIPEPGGVTHDEVHTKLPGLGLHGCALAQGDINRIAHIRLTQGVVDLCALALNIGEIGMHILHNFFHLVEFKPGVEAPRQPLDSHGPPYLGGLGNSLQSRLQHIGGKADRAR